ncbi:MAG TPA: transcription antitermination factor NusB [Clostridiales bacterium]|nr:transcription antitermination factor NusB [Clostridiales bacterium]
MSKRTARETAMKMLYQYSITGELHAEDVKNKTGVMDETALSAPAMDFVARVESGFREKEGEIDEMISSCSRSWKLERISKVDLAILRLAIFEIEWMDTPPKVAVNEAVEIAKAFSTEKSFQFINGLLGGYLKERRAE